MDDYLVWIRRVQSVSFCLYLQVHPFSDSEYMNKKMKCIHVNIYMCKLSSVGYVTATFTYDDAVQ